MNNNKTQYNKWSNSETFYIKKVENSLRYNTHSCTDLRLKFNRKNSEYIYTIAENIGTKK
ncbi:MAG: hypothetical protein KO253_03845 [Methanobrevibacter arboriphilus]|nr:hypothetical protein [Methanobrevibacter arboriphilus]